MVLLKSICFLLFLLLFSANATAANIAEVRIESVSRQAEAGNVVEFTFMVGNRVGPECAARIEYWIGTESEKIIAGKDTVFLAGSETKKEAGSLLVPEGTRGIETFFVAMQCNDAAVIASKPIKVVSAIPTILEFGTLDVAEGKPGEPISFSYQIKSNHGNELIVSIEEKVLQGSSVVWQHQQQSSVIGSAVFSKKGPILQQGSYSVVVEASYGGMSARIAREFAVAPLPFPLLQVITAAALLLLLFSAVFITARFIAPRTILSRQPVVPAETAFKAEKPLKKILKPVVQRLLLFESQSSGIPDEVEISRLLDGAGLKAAERKNALDSFVGRVQLQQTVKCYVVSKQVCSSGFETVVSFVVANNTNRNWLNMVILARLPKFLGSNVLSMASDAKTVVERYGGILQFTLKKVRAMQSATVSYSFDRLISQPEANTVPLPVVISFGESEPLVITEVREENPIVLEAGEGESSENELNVVAVKKAVKRVRAAKKLGKGRQSITN